MSILLRRFVAFFAVSIFVAASPALALADSPENANQQELTDDELADGDDLDGDGGLDDPSIDGPFSPGNVDATLHGGVSAFSYLWVEPGIDIGLVELSDGMVLGAGGSLNAGWCTLCPLLGLVQGIDSVSARYTNPMARATVHFNVLGDALDIPELDTYAGLAVGPSFYRFNMETDPDNEVSASVDARYTSFVWGPFLGMRYTFSGDSGFFVAGEYRIRAESGVSESSVQISGEEDDVVIRQQATDLQRGFSVRALNVGIGMRF